MDEKTITLFGGKPVTLTFDDGRTEAVTVRQFKLREYPALMANLDDEFYLVAMACGKPRAAIEQLQPESYETAHTTLLEVNAKGFFTFAARQVERNAGHLKNLPPGMVEKILTQKLTSATPLTTVPPPRG